MSFPCRITLTGLPKIIIMTIITIIIIIIIIIIIAIIPLFAFDIIYSINSSKVEQMPETNKQNQT